MTGKHSAISIDSHQHTHMIPLVFKTLMRVIKDESIDVEYMRIPAEPITPYLLTPSLYFSYSLTGLLKQWLLKVFAFVNRREWKKANIPSAYFMGVLFSGELTEQKIKKLLPQYLKLAEKNNRDIELGFHPGYLKRGESLIFGSRKVGKIGNFTATFDKKSVFLNTPADIFSYFAVYISIVIFLRTS